VNSWEGLGPSYLASLKCKEKAELRRTTPPRKKGKGRRRSDAHKGCVKVVGESKSRALGPLRDIHWGKKPRRVRDAEAATGKKTIKNRSHP